MNNKFNLFTYGILSILFIFQSCQGTDIAEEDIQNDVNTESEVYIKATDSNGNEYEYSNEYIGGELEETYIESIDDYVKRISIGNIFYPEGISFVVPFAPGTYKMGTEYENDDLYSAIVDMMEYQESSDIDIWYGNNPTFAEDESISNYIAPEVTISKIDEQIVEGSFKGTLILQDGANVGDYITFTSGSFKINTIENYSSGLDQHSASLAFWPYDGGSGGGGGGGSGSNINAFFTFGQQSSFITPGYPDMYLDEVSVDFENHSTGDIESYYWDFDDGSNSELENPNHVFDLYNISEDFSYNVTLHVFDAQGNEDTHSETVDGVMLRPIGVINLGGTDYEFGYGEGNALSNYYRWASVNGDGWLGCVLKDYEDGSFSSRDIELNMSAEPDIYNLFQQTGSIIPEQQGSQIGFYCEFRGYRTFDGGSSSGFMKKSNRDDVYEIINFEMQMVNKQDPNDIIDASINIVNLPHKDVFY